MGPSPRAAQCRLNAQARPPYRKIRPSDGDGIPSGGNGIPSGGNGIVFTA